MEDERKYSLDKIVNSIKSVCKHQQISPTDNAILEGAIKIYLGVNNFEDKKTQKVIPKLATDKQKELMKTLGVTFDQYRITAKEADKLIKEKL